MKSFSVGCGVLCLLLVTGCGGGFQTLDPHVDIMDSEDVWEFRAATVGKVGYVLAPNDQFVVDFLFDDKMDSQVRVRPDGRVALPIVGDIAVAGQTPGELDTLLTEAYSRYFQDPEVTINVIEFAPPSVYVMGKVKQPREIELRPGLTSLQAVALAGGPDRDANLGSVIVLRRVGSDRAYAQRVNLGKALKGKKGAWDMLLAPSDIVFVPESFVSKLDNFVDHLFGGLMPIPMFYLRGWEMFNTKDVYDTFLRQTITN